MRVFLTRANGWLGSAIARELIEAAHSGLGLARSKDNGEALAAADVTPLIGSLTDLHVLRQGAENADGIIHTALDLDFSKYEKLSQEDRTAIETFGEVLSGSERPVVVTSGVGLLPAGHTFTEDAQPPIIPDYSRASEQTAFALADRGLNASAVRPARSVHGLGERHGFVPMLAGLAREKGVSAYIGDGKAHGRPCTARMRLESFASHWSSVPATRHFMPLPKACR
jgi:nucleoside-diphosphate-sugar epimerase